MMGSGHFDPDGDDFRQAVALLVRRHDEAGRGAATEADISRAIVRFFDVTGLGELDEVRLEHDRNDLRTGDVLIEVKRRIGTSVEHKPDPKNVEQLDRYLAERIAAGDPERIGILTDGRYWLLRHPRVPEVRTRPPYAFELIEQEAGLALFEWLRDECQAVRADGMDPAADRVAAALGGRTVRSEALLDALGDVYGTLQDSASLRLKRDLWRDLLVAALGEVVEGEPQLDRLFVRHTYLSTVVSLAVQSAFGVDVRAAAAVDPVGLVDGTTFVTATGLRGVIESDFFGWVVETDTGCEWLADLARLVARFDWTAADYDFARVLYQSVIGAEDRRRLGEYYTPDWLAEAVVEAAVTDPLKQRVLDPACGSGTFLRAAIAKYIAAAREQARTPAETLEGLRTSVIGIDIHPVSVHLARSTWIAAAREVISAGAYEELTVPVYLGDSLQLRVDSGSLLGANNVTIELDPASTGRHGFLEFPRSLISRGDWFDKLLVQASRHIDSGLDPVVVLDEAGVADPAELGALARTFSTFQELHSEGRDHIWGYYTRNLVRPVWLSSEKGRSQVVVGNPPWLTLNRTESTLRRELERHCKQTYRTWEGGQFATQQDVAGFFFTRCLDLYLDGGGRIAMVMPHSALTAGHYRRWRSGEWGGRVAADFDIPPWDLERIAPNTFFPVPACVAFATRRPAGEHRALAERADRWIGPEGGPFDHETVALPPGEGFRSPYAQRSRNGATIFPRLLFFVEAAEVETAIVKNFFAVTPARSPYEKPPWKHLAPRELGGVVEKEHVWPVHLGETLAPFVLLEPRTAALPARRSDRGPALASLAALPSRAEVDGVNPLLLKFQMRVRWHNMALLWERHKKAETRLGLLEQLDFMGKLTAQLAEPADIRLVYSASGRPTAAVLVDAEPVLENTLYGVACESLREAHYLAAVINSATLWRAIEPLMPKGQYGPRHVHKHLWRLPIGAFDEGDPLHNTLAEAGVRASDDAARALEEMRAGAAAKGVPLSARVVRRELRRRLDEAELGRSIDAAVSELLARQSQVSRPHWRGTGCPQPSTML